VPRAARVPRGSSFESQRDIVASRQPLEKRRCLKHHGAFDAWRGHLLPVNQHATQRRPLQSRDDGQQRLEDVPCENLPEVLERIIPYVSNKRRGTVSRSEPMPV
jgi:hypothetical protein